jgi:hypothetical protein
VRYAAKRPSVSRPLKKTKRKRRNNAARDAAIRTAQAKLICRKHNQGKRAVISSHYGRADATRSSCLFALAESDLIGRGMEPNEALTSAAQLAIALAGFAGVVVAFRSSSLHEWSALDRYRLWLLLSSAVVPLFSSLIGMLLLTMKPVPVSIWRWCSLSSFFFTVAFVVLSRRRQEQVGPELKKQIGSYRYIFYFIATVGTLLGLLQVYNAAFLGAFWLFYAGVVYQLGTGALQFARMILLPPHTVER